MRTKTANFEKNCQLESIAFVFSVLVMLSQLFGSSEMFNFKVKIKLN